MPKQQAVIDDIKESLDHLRECLEEQTERWHFEFNAEHAVINDIEILLNLLSE
jgi:hypothetical protein